MDASKAGDASGGEFAPIRAEYVVGGAFGLATSLLGLIVGLPFARRPAVELVVAAALAVFVGGLILIPMRTMLRQVVPLPPGAVVVPARLAGRLAVSTAVRVAIVVLSFVGVLSVAFLGGTVGISLGLLWVGRQVQRFERDDGRCILRRRGVSRDKYLYAGPCP